MFGSTMNGTEWLRELEDLGGMWKTTTLGNFKNYEISRDSDKHIIEVAVPGLTKEDLKISFSGDKLLIKMNTGYNSKFVKGDLPSFTVPDIIDRKSSKAKVENGILTITLHEGEDAENTIDIL